MRKQAMVLILLLLPGCSTPQTEPPTCIFAKPHVGDIFEYSGTGAFETFATQNPIFDPKTSGGDGEQKILILDANDRIIVAIGDAAPRYNFVGAKVDAVHVTYWLKGPRTPQPAAINDEWIDGSGRPIQVALRNEEAYPTGNRHQTRLSRLDWPPLMFATLAHANANEGTFTPLPEIVATDGQARLGPFSFTVTLQGCLRTLTADTVFKNAYPGRHYVTTFNSSSPLPADFVATDPELHPGADLRLHLESFRPGSGAPVPDFVHLPLPPTTLALDTAPNRFLAGEAPDLPTSFDEAVVALKGDLSIAQWFKDHPDARPSEVHHILGDEGSDVVDEWWMLWWSTSGSTGMLVDRVKSPLPLGVGDFRRNLFPPGPVEEPKEGPRVRLDEMQRISDDVFKAKLEVIFCTFHDGTCQFGTHQATGAPRAGGVGGGVSWPGLYVDAARGYIMQEVGYSETGLGVPASYQ